ncbi:MAG: hypothetical protein RIR51_1738 [Bacteroidota bacterium]|jgi:REP element-mobilizing transposase RayT
MAHSLNQVWIHAVWGTKYREPIINEKIDKCLYKFIKYEFIKLKCFVEEINGTEDHIHVLFSLNRSLSISKIIRQVKGSSAHFFNNSNLLQISFYWQTGYSVFSVSKKDLKYIKKYILNQKSHHSNNKIIRSLEI